MYLLRYSTENELHETVNTYTQPFSSVDNALHAIQQVTTEPEKVVLSDYSNEERIEFRWLHVEAKFGGYYKLSSLTKIDCDEPLVDSI